MGVKVFDIGDEVTWGMMGDEYNGVIVDIIPKGKDYTSVVSDNAALQSQRVRLVSNRKRYLIRDDDGKLFIPHPNRLSSSAKTTYAVEKCIIYRLQDYGWQRKAATKIAENNWFGASADKFLRIRQAQEIIDQFIHLLGKAAIYRGAALWARANKKTTGEGNGDNETQDI